MSFRVFHADAWAEMKTDHYLYQITYGRKLTNENHAHDFYEIVYIIEGKCVHNVNGEKHFMQAGNLAFLRPGDSHFFTSQSDHTNLISLSVTPGEMSLHFALYGPKLGDRLLNAPIAPQILLSVQQQSDIEQTVLSMGKDQKILYLKIILGKALQFYLINNDINKTNDVPNRFLTALLQMNTPENISEGVPALLRLANFSHAQLCRLMRKHAGITPQQYIMDLRMNLAYELISNSDMDIGMIADKVGYASQSHFTAAFRRKFGQTPVLVRKLADKYFI